MHANKLKLPFLQVYRRRKKVNQENSTKHKNLHIKLRMLFDGEEEGGGGQETNKHECEHQH